MAEAALAASGRRLVVVDQTEMKDDLVQDMISVLTSRPGETAPAELPKGWAE